MNTEDRVKEINSVNTMGNEELKNYYRQLSRKISNLVGEITSYRSQETNDQINQLLELNEKQNIVVNRIVGKAIM